MYDPVFTSAADETEDDVENKSGFLSIPSSNIQIAMTEMREDVSITDDTFEPELVIEKFKIALTFLLHPNSPLHDENYTSEANDANLVDQSLGKPKLSLSAELRTFQKRCQIYNNDTNDGNSESCEQCLEDLLSFDTSEYKSQWDILHKLWTNWRTYASDENFSEDNCIDNEEDGRYLEDCSDEYQLSKQNLGYTRRGTTLRKMITDRMTPSPLPVSPKDKRGDLMILSSLKSERRICQIKDVNSLKKMQKWVKHNKEKADGAKCGCCQSSVNKLKDELTDFSRQPMFLWPWQHVVNFIETIDEIRHFASVFWQYQINGRELCAMTQKQIEYLIECSLINNHKIEANNIRSLKSNIEQQNQIWPIAQEAKVLKSRTDKARIKQHIVCRYHLGMRVLDDIMNKINNDSVNKLGDDAEKIDKLIKLLRIDVGRGPKYFWKMDAIFFHKIDNFLAVLLAPRKMRKIYQKCFSDFLVDENVNKSEHSTNESNDASISAAPYAQKRQRNKQTSPDLLDHCVDRMCPDTTCSKFIHNIDRVYLKALLCFVCALLFGVLSVSIWYYESSVYQGDIAMSLSLEAIGKRARNQFLNEFWIPQMIMNAAISTIKYSKLLTKSAANTDYQTQIRNNPDIEFKYDKYMASFHQIQDTENVWAFWLYNNDTNGFIGALRDENEIIISQFNGTCQIQWYYDSETKQRDLQRLYHIKCGYKPRTRPWYSLAVDKLGINKAKWTDPYQFYTHDFAGMSLVSSFMDEDTLLILLAEITVNTLVTNSKSDQKQTTFNNLPTGTILMIAASNLDIILSSTNEVDVASVDYANCVSTDCKSQNELITSSMNYIRTHQEMLQLQDKATNESSDIIKRIYDKDHQYSVSIFPFRTLYLDFFSGLMNHLILNETESQYGYVIMVDNSQYLELINQAWYTCWGICTAMLVLGVFNICWQIRYDIQEGYDNLAYAPSRSELINYDNKSSNHAMTLRTIESFAKSPSTRLLMKSHSLQNLLKMEKSHSVRNLTGKGPKNKIQTKRAKTVNTYAYENQAGTDEFQTDEEFKNDEKSVKLKPELGNQVRTVSGKTGIVRFVGKLLGVSSDDTVWVGIELSESIDNEDNNCFFVKLDEIESINEGSTSLQKKKERRKRSINQLVHLLSHSDFLEEEQKSNNKESFNEVWCSGEPFQSNDDIISLPSPEPALDRTDITSNKKQSESDRHKSLKLARKYLSKKSLLVVTVLEILVTFIIVCCVWEVISTKATDALLNDIMAKHEYNEVADEVIYMFETSNKIKDVFQDQYQNVMSENDSVAIDHFFVDMMKSYLRYNSESVPSMIYVGLPDGGFFGGQWSDDGLWMVRRDKSTNWSRFANMVTDGGIIDYTSTDDRGSLYDPRCRPWYQSAIENSFNGNINDAFPNNLFETFYNEQTDAALTGNCETAKADYMDLFGVIHNDTLQTPLVESELFYLSSNYSLTWERYIFGIQTGTIGLTASAPIIDEHGSLVAVVAIDWTLSNLNEVLAASTDQKNNWFSWIIEANDDMPVMIASSDGTTVTTSESLQGCLTFDGGETEEMQPYASTEHPQYLIRVMSKQILNAYVSGRNISMLPVNSALPQQINVPIDLPILEAGRIQYYLTEYFEDISFNVDWVVFKTIDVSYLSVDDLRFAIIMLCATMFCVCILFARFYQKESDEDDESISTILDGTLYDIDKNETKRSAADVMKKMKPIIVGSSKAVWSKLYKNCEGIIDTATAQDFCANRANELIAANDKGSYYPMLLKCAWEYLRFNSSDESQRKAIQSKEKFIDFINSKVYNFVVLFTIVIHLGFTLFEPPTPSELKQNGLAKGTMSGLIICLLVEIVDLLLLGIKRFIEFSLDYKVLLVSYELNYDIHHKYVRQLKRIPDRFNETNSARAFYLLFMGPKASQYMAHIILLVLIFLNLALTVSLRIGIFSYWIPILPFLFILRNRQIKQFGRDFANALSHSTDVIFSYFCFIILFSVFAMSLFDEISKIESEGWSLKGFDSISHTIVTAFVFISTAENYGMIYDIFEADYYANSRYGLLLWNALSFLLIFGLLGLFCFMPMIIHRFEESFNECEIRQSMRDHFRKTNCIIAAFIMLDMDMDQTIDKLELKQLISKSVLSNRNKLLDVFNTNDEDDKSFNPNDDDAYGVDGAGIDLTTFVNYLLTQKLRNKLVSSTVPYQSQLSAFLECNLFRRSQYNNLVFIMIVIPVFVVSMLKGLNGINDITLDYVIFAFFILNFIEINVRWATFGLKRFWDLEIYRNPNYIVSAINKYYTSQKFAEFLELNNNNNDVIRLTSNQRRWAISNLMAVKPLSTGEKSILTLMHRIELCTIYITFFSYILAKSWTKSWMNGEETQQGYQTYFLQFGVLLRTFTLINTNSKLTYSVFTVFPQFIALLTFLGLYIYCWARVGCALFGNNVTSIVIEDVYDATIVANFDTTAYSILCLIQLMVGEGWHEVMYMNSIATSFVAVLYFMVYITVVTIFISNIFVGLFLAGIDNLEMEQNEMKVLQQCMKSNKAFRKYAVEQLSLLKYKLSENENETRKTKQQINQISFLLKQTQKHTIYQ